jgi:hypothetical protein
MLEPAKPGINMLDYALGHDSERLTQCKADVKEAYIVCIRAGRLLDNGVDPAMTFAPRCGRASP